SLVPPYTLQCGPGTQAGEGPVTKEELLTEVDDLIRTMPQDIRYGPDGALWIGRAAALVHEWDWAQSVAFDLYHAQMLQDDSVADPAMTKLMALIYRMRSDLLMKTRGPLSTVIGKGMVFDYFDELRKIIERARQDLFVVDPYLDADFVSRYLQHVHQPTQVRLLARDKLPPLMTAARMLAQQAKLVIEVRSAPSFHDRYLFVDKAACYQSGASFKDGGRTAPTTLTQITDAFPAM